jgi:hypothetical protein
MDQSSTEPGTECRSVSDLQAPPVLARLRAALRLLENEHITPQGRRILERILDEEEGRDG